MGKKVVELAKEYNMDKRDLLNHMKELGIFVSSHLSQLTEEEVDRVRSTVSEIQEKVEVVEKRIKPTVIRRKTKETKPAKKPEGQVDVEKKKEILGEVVPLTEAGTALQVAASQKAEAQKGIHEKAPAKKEKGKRKKKRIEPAKIIEMPLAKAVPKPTELTELTPKEVPIQEPSLLKPAIDEKKEKPKKKKAKKEYEIISEKRPGRSRPTLKKKEIFHTKDGWEERNRYLSISQKKKMARKGETQKTEITIPKSLKRKIRMHESIVVNDLAKRMGIKAGEVVKKLLSLGVMTTINNSIDFDVATLVSGEFDYEVEKIAVLAEEIFEKPEVDADETLESRPPVVTVMGHVDHGKTSLLDAIRETNVIDQEFGGITQHIGAHLVHLANGDIVFLDTPGHESFTAMRARGAKVTDIVVLVVAADDGVMQQTKEAIDHAKAAGVPIIVAVNKIDKPNAQPEKVRKELSPLGLVAEEWGGETIFCEVSAKQKTGIKELLDYILLQAEMMELKANPSKKARGTIIEAKLDRGRGPVATVLVQEGTLRINDPFVSGGYSGKVRLMIDNKGNKVKEAGPSIPVEVVGFSGIPPAGKPFMALSEEKDAKDIEEYIQAKQRESELAQTSKLTLEGLLDQKEHEETKELNVVIKADVQGSMEAVTDAFKQMSGDKVKVGVIHSSAGGITENDVMLATASNAIVIGFNVRPEARANSVAEEEGVEIRLYRIIYDLIEDIQKAMLGLLEPTFKENILGRGEVIEIFKIPKVGTVAGTSVTEGKIVSGAKVRLIRDSKVVYEGKLSTLKRYQDDVKEALAGMECGLIIENFNDVKVNDVIEVLEYEEIAPEL